jgi:YHS domain-containing protein
MIRAFIVEFLFPLVLFLIIRALLKNFFASFRSRQRPQANTTGRPPLQAGGELKRDPVCGTYVSTAVSVTNTVNGQVVHFCSKECRDRYHA